MQRHGKLNAKTYQSFEIKPQMEIITGLSKWKIDETRKVSRDVGSGMPISARHIQRERLSPDKIDHILDFIAQPHYLQDVAYGTKSMKLSTGQPIVTPNVIRTVIYTRLIDTYKLFCTEVDFEPFSDRTLFRILNLCASSKRRNLAGLDGIMLAGNDTCLTLEKIRSQLEDDSVYTEESQLKTNIQMCRKYLKTDFKVHIALTSTCPSHCIQYA